MYKFIDGKYYEVKEVSIDDLKVEVNQVLSLIKEQSEKINIIKTQIVNVEKPIEAQIVNYQNQIASIQNALEELKTKKVNVVQPYENQIVECNEKIEHAKATLMEKKDIIKSLLPDANKTLGF